MKKKEKRRVSLPKDYGSEAKFGFLNSRQDWRKHKWEQVAHSHPSSVVLKENSLFHHKNEEVTDSYHSMRSCSFPLTLSLLHRYSTSFQNSLCFKSSFQHTKWAHLLKENSTNYFNILHAIVLMFLIPKVVSWLFLYYLIVVVNVHSVIYGI